MTERVDFYVLKSAVAKSRWTLACRLIEKAYLRDLRIVVANDTPADVKALDELLWTFNDNSFIPHNICHDGAAMDPAARVHLTVAGAATADADLLVNMSTSLPAHWERYGRIVEIIDADDERRRLGRERFKNYRDHKVTLETHQMDETADA